MKTKRLSATIRGQQGYTLAELLVVMVIIGIMGALGTGGWLQYQRSVEQRGSAQELVSALRNAQQASLSEAATYCVQIDTSTRTYGVFKFSCGPSGSPAQPAQTTQSARIGLASASFLQPDGSVGASVSFFPRGAATKGSVRVTRQGSSKVYIISVEGLTGRVSLAG